MGKANPDPNQTGAQPAPVLVASVGAGDHVLGLADAPLTLVVYGDYQCPYTRAVMPVIRDVRERLGDELRYVYRHFPLHQIHPHAQTASEAAEAADAQGCFWRCTTCFSRTSGSWACPIWSDTPTSSASTSIASSRSLPAIGTPGGSRRTWRRAGLAASTARRRLRQRRAVRRPPRDGRPGRRPAGGRRHRLSASWRARCLRRRSGESPAPRRC